MIFKVFSKLSNCDSVIDYISLCSQEIILSNPPGAKLYRARDLSSIQKSSALVEGFITEAVRSTWEQAITEIAHRMPTSTSGGNAEGLVASCDFQ